MFQVLGETIITITKNDILNLRVFGVYELFTNLDYLLFIYKVWVFITQVSVLLHWEKHSNACPHLFHCPFLSTFCTATWF